jgi:hypothetical protein
MISVRSSTENDVEAMCSVAARNGLSLKASEWQGFWSSNPCHEAFSGVPAGWLMEADGIPVGGILNIHMMYDLEGRQVRGAIGSGAAVDLPYRNRSVMLIGKFLGQKTADLCLVGSANAAMAQFFNVFARRIPSPDSDVPFLWPGDHRLFATAVLKRKKVAAAPVLALPAGAVLRILETVRQKRERSSVRIEVGAGFDDRFDALWERIRRGPPRLRALRTRANLEWRFQRELRQDSIRVLAAGNGTDLCGYVVLVRTVRGEFGMPVYEIADLQAVNDDAAVIRPLILEALNVVRAERTGMLKFRAWNQAKRNVARELGAYSYRYSLWQAYYSSSNAELAPALVTAGTWDFSPFEIF